LAIESDLAASSLLEERSLGHQEKVKSRERNQVDSQLSKVSVQFTRESKRGRDSARGLGHKSVQLAVRGLIVLEDVVVDIVQSFVVDDEGFVRVFKQLVGGKNSVVRLNDGVGNLGGRIDGVGGSDSVWVSISDLQQKQGSHTGTGSSSKGVEELESLRSIALLDFHADSVQDFLDQFGTFGVVTLGPVVTSSVVSEAHVVGLEKRSDGASFDHVHSSRLKVDQDGSGDPLAFQFVLGCASEVDVNVLQFVRDAIAVGVVNGRGVKFALWPTIVDLARRSSGKVLSIDACLSMNSGVLLT